MDYATVVHKCCCGCGHEVVTPLSPTDWRLTYDGVSVSLSPSVGNWGFACQSHYWIDKSVVRWAGQWTPEQVEAGRARDRLMKQQYYGARKPAESKESATSSPRPGLWSRLRQWWSR
ncbi:DUF6527 family protein [Methyloceanibacter methanicus]|uniref:DUF6527 family protein n=1 Tax=Methyloceanibacter methanicus TaxID=1774968 RepID=UPI001FCD0C8E